MLFPMFAAASVVLLASGGPIQITEAQVEAAQYGRILGAAAQCRGIDQQRVNAATHHATLAVRALVSSSQELETARGSFENAALRGGSEVSEGRESCQAAEESLKEIEQKFGPEKR